METLKNALKSRFKLNPETIDEIVEKYHKTINFMIEHEWDMRESAKNIYTVWQFGFSAEEAYKIAEMVIYVQPEE